MRQFTDDRAEAEYRAKVAKLARPKVTLVGEDGNAFAIMGRCTTAAKDAGWSKERIKAVMDDMTSGDYDHLLGVAMKEFDAS